MFSRCRFVFAYYFLFLVIGLAPAVNALEQITVEMPMRDGYELPTDIYLPTTASRRLPCVLIRSPNGRAWLRPRIEHLVEDGYCVAVQDTRSCTDKAGKTLPYIADGWGELQDGYDTVQWLAQSPYTNGRIGTMGESALGITQLMMAPSQPPHLVCQHIGVAASSLYHHAVFPGGRLLESQVKGWIGAYASDPEVLRQVTEQSLYSELWQALDSMAVADRVQVPGLLYGGWYDIFSQGTIDAFVTRQEKGNGLAKGGQKLVLGPWTHFWPHVKEFGDFSIPKNAEQSPIDYSPKRWFDHYLKGESNGIEKMPPVTYYVMGPFDNQQAAGHFWRTADHWPPPAKTTRFYLSQNGKLATQPVIRNTQAAVIPVDPENPVATLGGRNLFLTAGPVDQRRLEEREDVIVFSSEVLEQDTEVTGRIRAFIQAAASDDNQGLVMHVCDVYPDGKSVLIVEGAAPVSRKRQQVDIDLWSTSMVFAKGHRIRVTLAGSSAPRYALPKKPGTITVWLDGVHHSRLELPIYQAGSSD